VPALEPVAELPNLDPVVGRAGTDDADLPERPEGDRALLRRVDVAASRADLAKLGPDQFQRRARRLAGAEDAHLLAIRALLHPNGLRHGRQDRSRDDDGDKEVDQSETGRPSTHPLT